MAAQSYEHIPDEELASPSFVPPHVEAHQEQTHDAIAYSSTPRPNEEPLPNVNGSIAPSASDEDIANADITSVPAEPQLLKGGKDQTLSTFTILDWWWELLSWVIGTLSLFALLLLLALFSDKAVTSWNSKVSINAIVSALAQTAQSSLAVSLGSGISQLKWDWLRTRRQRKDIETFDNASRGPLGSLVLVWKHIFRIREIHPAQLGALATVFLVTFSTFAQQAINSRERTAPLTYGGTICRANNFTVPSTEDQGRDITITHGALDGLSREKISFSEVSGQCPGKRCVWDVYNSLGICVHTGQVVNATFTCTSSPTTCTLSKKVDSFYNKEHLQKIAQGMYEKSDTFQMWSPASYQPAINDTAHIYFALTDRPNNTDTSTNTSLPITFFKATFEICMHTYSTIVEGKETFTELLRHGPALTKDPNWRWTPDRGKPRYRDCGETDGVAACLNAYNKYDSTFLLRYLSQDLLKGRGVEYDAIIFLLRTDFQKPDGIERTATRMQNLAVSLSNAMRQSPHSAEMIEGLVEYSEQYFCVVIPWLILPVVVWLCSSVFLLVTLLVTKRHRSPMWEASPLILLDCKSEDVDLVSDRTVRKREKRWASEAVLEENDGSWRLCEHPS